MLSTSETVKDLESIEGRRLLHDFYHDRRVKNALEAKTLLECWKLCRRGTDLQFGDRRRVRFETHLGFKLGTRVFLEEIVSTYYANFIQGLVYAGAMVVLLTVALYLAGSSLWFAIVGLALEAVFLLMLAIVTAYSPNEEAGAPTGTLATQDNLLSSINSSIHEMTTAVSDLFRLISQTDIRQDVLLTRLTESIGKMNTENARRSAEKLEQTNGLLREMNDLSRAQLQNILQQQQQSLQHTRRLLSLLERSEGQE
ncbi:MAG: hypothetical protein JXA28_04455 [Bacteroidetes bacterium]|nr:hypothetical protein [Bacteroidota bacterium]